MVPDSAARRRYERQTSAAPAEFASDREADQSSDEHEGDDHVHDESTDARQETAGFEFGGE